MFLLTEAGDDAEFVILQSLSDANESVTYQSFCQRISSPSSSMPYTCVRTTDLTRVIVMIGGRGELSSSSTIKMVGVSIFPEERGYNPRYALQHR